MLKSIGDISIQSPYELYMNWWNPNSYPIVNHHITITIILIGEIPIPSLIAK